MLALRKAHVRKAHLEYLDLQGRYKRLGEKIGLFRGNRQKVALSTGRAAGDQNARSPTHWPNLGPSASTPQRQSRRFRRGDWPGGVARLECLSPRQTAGPLGTQPIEKAGNGRN